MDLLTVSKYATDDRYIHIVKIIICNSQMLLRMKMHIWYTMCAVQVLHLVTSWFMISNDVLIDTIMTYCYHDILILILWYCNILITWKSHTGDTLISLFPGNLMLLILWYTYSLEISYCWCCSTLIPWKSCITDSAIMYSLEILYCW